MDENLYPPPPIYLMFSSFNEEAQKLGGYAWFAKTVHSTAKRTDATTCRGAMERYPTPTATADLGHAVGAEIAWCGY